MILIEEIAKATSIPPHSERDSVVMGWEQRRRSRQRVRTVKERELALALPTGTVLHDGDLLYIGEDFSVAVESKHEDLLVSPLHPAAFAAMLAYELGNRHLPVSIRDGFLATPYDRLVEELLVKMAIPFERRKDKFEPMSMQSHHG